jgi:hypothetical protein
MNFGLGHRQDSTIVFEVDKINDDFSDMDARHWHEHVRITPPCSAPNPETRTTVVLYFTRTGKQTV